MGKKAHTINGAYRLMIQVRSPKGKIVSERFYFNRPLYRHVFGPPFIGYFWVFTK